MSIEQHLSAAAQWQVPAAVRRVSGMRASFRPAAPCARARVRALLTTIIVFAAGYFLLSLSRCEVVCQFIISCVTSLYWPTESNILGSVTVYCYALENMQ